MSHCDWNFDSVCAANLKGWKTPMCISPISIHHKSCGFADTEHQVIVAATFEEATLLLCTSHNKWDQTGESYSLDKHAAVRCHKAKFPSFTAVKVALLAIFSRSMINHFPPLRGAADTAADSQMSHDKSPARRWHQSPAMPSLWLPAPVAAVASVHWDTIWQLLRSLSSVFSVV